MAIDEGRFVRINGQDQWVAVRGRDRKNPVLLILHGGPGFPTSFMAPAFAAWEERFTVVHWDQPGGGATYSKNAADQGRLTHARYVADGLAVAEWLRGHLGVEQIALLGTSWGSALGVMMIQRRPELFFAYAGAAQAVSGPQGDRVGYEMALAAARERGDATGVAALEKIGTPPWPSLQEFLVRQTYTNPPGLPPTPEEARASAAFGKVMMTPPPPGASWIAPGLPPYDGPKVFMETLAATFGEMRRWEARAYGLEFRTPVFVFQGDHDLNTPAGLAREWVEEIEAPAKAFEIVPGAGHGILAFTSEILALLERHVRPLAPGRT
ncbi:MAG TPA: alpha/beta hydrolase [Phenylobacterium sp.]|nr:alpha/beta hydrolase [Phenylobacterium sp.]